MRPFRVLLAALALALLVAAGGMLSVAAQVMPPTLSAPPNAPPLENPVAQGNQRPGGTQWQRTVPAPPRTALDYPEGNTPDDGAGPSEVDRWEPPVISGYADRASVAPGDTSGAFDRAEQNATTPPGLVVLSASPVTDLQGQPSVANSAYYRQGGMVFTAGTVDWAWGLDDWRQARLVDPRVQRVTANVLEAFRPIPRRDDPWAE